MKSPITLTPAAEQKIRNLLEETGKYALRIDMKGGGCAGFSYDVSLADEKGEKDDLIEANGARVIVHPESLMFLIGTELDYQTTLLDSGFKFNNPNVMSACGCGTSVAF